VADCSRGRRRLRRCLPLLLAAIALAGCTGNEGRAPSTLRDGTSAPELSVELEGIDDQAILTRVRTVGVRDVEPGSLAAECLRGRARDARPKGQLVERIGVASETVTLRDTSGLHGCDDSPGPREEDRRWCGSSFGRLYGGHLRDPRLDIAGCTTADGLAMGFAWVEASRGARYVVVEQPGYVEVYEVAGGLPVRVATATGVEIEGSCASFDLREHAADGRLLRAYRLEAAVAG